VLPPPTWVAPKAERHEAGASGLLFRCTAAVAVTVHVIGPDRAPVAGAWVAAVPSAGADRHRAVFDDTPFCWSTAMRTAADGSARLEGLDPAGGYVLGVRGPPAAGFADAVTDPWKPGEVTVRLTAGLALSGKAVDADGRPVHGAWIRATSSADGQERETQSREDGTFSFQGLPPGAVTLHADWSDAPGAPQKRSRSGWASTEAGQEGVELRLR
jgi:hypothetical protein